MNEKNTFEVVIFLTESDKQDLEAFLNYIYTSATVYTATTNKEYPLIFFRRVPNSKIGLIAVIIKDLIKFIFS